MCQGLNFHYFHIIGDGHQPKSVGVYIPIIRIPSLKVGGLVYPNKNATTLTMAQIGAKEPIEEAFILSFTSRISLCQKILYDFYR